jgi:hypothetical protein
VPRKGVKRSDRRWIADDGQEWASKFEHDVYYRLRGDGYRVRKCDSSDSVTYQSPVKQGSCLECGSADVVQLRTYTPDLFVLDDPTEPGGPRYIVECKGKFTGDKRNLFRHLAAQWGKESPPLRIVFQSNRLPGIKSSSIEWAHKFCKNVTPGLWTTETKKRPSSITWYPYER